MNFRHSLLQARLLLLQFSMYVIFIKNTPGSSVNELRHRIFTKNNLSEDHLPSTLDTLVLHLNRALTYINQRLFNILSELFFFIYQEYQI